ncbi:hypothetical protein [Staphylococcus phage vB_SauH_DELF3]|nr:hypothetical protein [Staphylococcus phage vB_SauH_DELF3]
MWEELFVRIVLGIEVKLVALDYSDGDEQFAPAFVTHLIITLVDKETLTSVMLACFVVLDKYDLRAH